MHITACTWHAAAWRPARGGGAAACGSTRRPLRAPRLQAARINAQLLNSGGDATGWGGRGCPAQLACGAAAVALAALIGACPQAAWAGAADTFAAKCAGCHLGGGNVLQPGATLFTEDLQRNGRATPEALYEIIYKGKGKMPGFGQDCAPKGQCTFGPRFSDEEVAAQAEYVLERAAAGWKAPAAQ